MLSEQEFMNLMLELPGREPEFKQLWDASLREGLTLEEHLQKHAGLFDGSQIARSENGIVRVPYKQNDAGPMRKHVGMISADSHGLRSWLLVHEHPRYVPIKQHNHTFIEMNYMLSGSCENIIEGRRVRMQAGDLCILAPSCSHQIRWCEERDILLNIILFPHCAERIIQNTSWGDNPLTAFFVNALYQSGSRNYMLVPKDNDAFATQLLQRILQEYFDLQPKGYLIEELCRSFFALTAQRICDRPQSVYISYETPVASARLIPYIKDHCATATRSEVAGALGYNESYVSTLIRKSTNKTFVQLRNDFRLERIEQELNTTTMPVKEIAEKYGFEGLTHFYKLYQKKFGKLPRT